MGWQQDLNLNIYPVPAANKITINIAGKSPADMFISIVTVEGRLIKQWNQPAISNPYVETISVTDLPVGNYHLIISTNIGQAGKQFSIIR